ncbi:sialin [Brachionus plicatilis]|uniref:Sialin n=1 Tax=Brachionus plicatilis TaxID=10195 RepID=A0A3M7PYY8_BRAPC|nr:sialin [Brachionus plicatilis]
MSKVAEKCKVVAQLNSFELHSFHEAVLWGAGHLVNINEISGPFSGIVFGVSNTLATIPGIIAPYVVGVLTKNVQINKKTHIKTILAWEFDFKKSKSLIKIFKLGNYNLLTSFTLNINFNFNPKELNSVRVLNYEVVLMDKEPKRRKLIMKIK